MAQLLSLLGPELKTVAQEDFSARKLSFQADSKYLGLTHPLLWPEKWFCTYEAAPESHLMPSFKATKGTTY